MFIKLHIQNYDEDKIPTFVEEFSYNTKYIKAIRNLDAANNAGATINYCPIRDDDPHNNTIIVCEDDRILNVLETIDELDKILMVNTADLINKTLQKLNINTSDVNNTDSPKFISIYDFVEKIKETANI